MLTQIHPDWDLMQTAAAGIRGWGIFPGFAGQKGRAFLLQKNELNQFDTDETVWVFVWSQANQGVAICEAALAFMRKHSPVEYQEIQRFGLGIKTSPTRFSVSSRALQDQDAQFPVDDAK